MEPKTILLSSLSLIVSLLIVLTEAYPPGFYKHPDGCLYAYIEDGSYHITMPESEPQHGSLSKVSYDPKSTCTKGTEPGRLFVVFEINDNFMHKMSLDLTIKPSSQSAGYWEVSQAVLMVDPVNGDLFEKKEYDLKPVDIYAGDKFSYSCYGLVMQNLMFQKEKPSFRITLKRFQLQPFAELPDFIFAPSFDCSVWFSLPVIMGLIVALFILYTVFMGVYLIGQQGNQTSDLKFSKQGGMLMNQAQLDATKG